MQERFAAADGNNGRPDFAQPVDPANHFRGVHRLRKIVKLIAVGAGQIAAPDRNDVHEQGMPRGEQSPDDAAQFAGARAPGSQSPARFGAEWHRLTIQRFAPILNQPGT
jgi:hypothetical protein